MVENVVKMSIKNPRKYGFKSENRNYVEEISIIL